jgi:molybdopterin/thiamine biosynthesis adenylyltransferase
MVAVLAAAAALWAIGATLKMPVSARLLMLALLYLAVLAVQVALPAGHPLREALGGSAGEWLVLGGIGFVVWVYVRGLRRLRGHVRQENLPRQPTAGSSAELERNARHIVLREIGGPGQKRLKEARVLVVGAGGLGSPALLYLAAAGIGTIGVIDHDVVDNSNLQRQVIHTNARIGMPKVFSAEIAMSQQNPFVTIHPYNRRLDASVAHKLFADYDLVLDGTDEPETRYLVNKIAVERKIPLISAAISQWEGQISVFDPSRDAPCYRCVFPQAAAPGLAPSCAEGGVLSALPGILGTMMAAEAIKVLSGAGTPLLGRLMIYDALHADTRTIRIARRADCPTCGASGA